MANPRLTEIQIVTLKQLAITCANGGMSTLTRKQREAMVPLWRRNLIEIWTRQMPGERSRGPFFKPTDMGWALIRSIYAGGERRDQERQAA
ncbi:hypothetical protein [Bradyrhizobium betae]|uniref:Antirepressor protein C-terminal domain-containing protein n=1 Tax=Bradyrhizobium betae TaxID=244734 RepID=A0A5P6P190_9BRAD|nr:hypothetical protein [Bradyrhizobium betae]MCS3725466.1 hypothetical protein [Bradyrhizobium betae]QFI71243.1 hypothetical protein F8237_01945 [Bradyrhizobium betae]